MLEGHLGGVNARPAAGVNVAESTLARRRVIVGYRADVIAPAPLRRNG